MTNNFLFTDKNVMSEFAGEIQDDVEIHTINNLHETINGDAQVIDKLLDSMDDEGTVVIAYIQKENLFNIDAALKSWFEVFHGHSRPSVDTLDEL